ncbi:MAG: hypothetical protein AB7U23_15790 [Dehalococcoidia bacterium]
MFPETRFLAFDIFGIEDERPLDDFQRNYFKLYSNASAYDMSMKMLRDHGLLLDRCELHKGYFSDTVPTQLERYRDPAGRKIAFAFLDCNITASYEYLFGLLPPCVHPRGFIYMDEYHDNSDVPVLFRKFVQEVEETRGFGVELVRNAGGFGALYRFHGNQGEL